MNSAGSNAAPWLWNDLREFFETDDGSLPEIRVDYVDTGATVIGYALLREGATRLVSEGASFWSEAHSEERLVDSVPSAAALVVSGDVESFHVVLGGIESGGVTIPDLGVFVCADQIALDYRNGDGLGSEGGQRTVRTTP